LRKLTVSSCQLKLNTEIWNVNPPAEKKERARPRESGHT